MYVQIKYKVQDGTNQGHQNESFLITGKASKQKFHKYEKIV